MFLFICRITSRRVGRFGVSPLFWKKILYIENKHSFRKQAFELLILFLEYVRGREEAQTDLLGAAINLQPFCAKYSGVNLMTLPLSAPDKTAVLLPASSPPTIQESVDLLETLLAFVDKSEPDIFTFWWELLKQQYLMVFFPSIWPQKTTQGKIGFPKCPEEVQAVLLQRLNSLVRKKSLSEVLWNAEENKMLLLEILRQSMSLHVNFDVSIKCSIGVFYYSYMEVPPACIPADELLKYRTVYVKELASILTPKTILDSSEISKRHETLCREVITLFKRMFLDLPDQINEMTREVIFYTLLDAASDLLSPNKSNPDLAVELHGVLLDTILFLWVYTRTKVPQHWERLCTTLAGLFHSMETIVQVSNKIMQLTMVLLEKIYFVQAVKKKKTAKRPGIMGGEQSAKHMEPKSPDSESPPKLPSKDEQIWKIEWTVEEALFVWSNILQIFGNVNAIRDPSIHSGALKTIWSVVQSVMWKEDQVPYQETLDTDRPPFLCMIDIFGPLLFAACDLPDAFVDGKAEAYKILCRIFCRSHIRPLPLDLLSHFYAVIQQGLTTRDNKNLVQNEIFRHSSNIFNLGLPGVNILIPYYLVEIRRVLTGEGRSNDVKERAAILLCSLISFSSHLMEVEIPVGSGGNGEKGSRASKDNANIQDFLRIAGGSGRGSALQTSMLTAPFPLSGLLNEVVAIMTDALKLDSTDPIIQIRLIWGLCVALFEIVYSSNPHALTTQGLVLTLLKHLSGYPKAICRAAIHAVSALVEVAEPIRAIDESIVTTIVDSISSNILKEMNDFKSKGTQVEETLISDQLLCLLEWVLALGDHVCNSKMIARVFEALECSLTSVVKTSEQARPARAKRKSMRPFTTMDESFTEVYSLLVNIDPSTVLLPLIRDTAENVIFHLLHFLHNFPGKEGIEVLSSMISHTDDLTEEQEAKVLHFIHNDSVVFSFVEVPRPDGEGHFARVIARDCIGKYCWDTNIDFDYDNYDPPPPTPFPFTDVDGNPLLDYQSPRLHSDSAPPVPRNVDPSQLPLSSNAYSEKTDQLDQLLTYLGHTYPDCLPDGGALNAPAAYVDAQKARIDFTEAALVAQIEEDKNTMDQMQLNVPPPQVWQHQHPSTPFPLGSYHHCRMLMSHFGFLNPDFPGNLALVTGDNDKIIRCLNQLDLTNGREIIKVGVIYLKEGQEEQIDVLRNSEESRSPLFAEFVRSMGWPIDVQTHRAYLGGLTGATTGATAPYYANSMYELIFHDLTSMPTTDQEQQIHKKRHVGNDNVHVIWTEHVRDYNPRTIVSEFNDAHIVVYPLPNGMFKIHVFQKENVDLFGPLMHGMCVTKRTLPVLIRVTSVMANKYVRYNQDQYVAPYLMRKKLLNTILERHKSDVLFREFIGQVVP
mmetsp:Transcript_43818/g.61588  ORF Transcript_43818/g.61588 Transcript_43818/m.61588 type:complete len:1380 (+) Transcript_43818:2-4141(+)